jgi:hypothetical protein
MAYIDNPVDSTNCWDNQDFCVFHAEVEHFTDNAGWDFGDMLEMVIRYYNDGESSDETVNKIVAILREND